MAFSLSRRAGAAGYRLADFDTIGSTSEEGLARARAGDHGPLWLVSSEQTAGRGRRGSPWQTARGNLAASLLLTTDLPPATIAQLGFVAGVALAQALEGLIGPSSLPPHAEVLGEAEPRSTQDGGASFEAGLQPAPQDEEGGSFRSGASPTFTLKWPNDVLADGKKLAGILVQTEAISGGRHAVVVGIGVNVRHIPEGVAYPTTSLDGLGVAVEAEALFGALSGAWVDAAASWDGGRGFAAVREAWLARAGGLAGEVAVRLGAEVVRGRFETIDETGQLVVRGSDGSCRRVSAGEVHFGGAASQRLEVHS